MSLIDKLVLLSLDSFSHSFHSVLPLWLQIGFPRCLHLSCYLDSAVWLKGQPPVRVTVFIISLHLFFRLYFIGGYLPSSLVGWLLFGNSRSRSVYPIFWFSLNCNSAVLFLQVALTWHSDSHMPFPDGPGTLGDVLAKGRWKVHHQTGS